MSTTSDIRNVVLLGHKGAGKTSLVEAVLFVAKVTPKLGKAGDRTAGLDDSPEERAHRTTFETRPVTLPWGSKKVTLIDTPGEASFMADARLALAAVDAAVVCVSARDGVQTGTERALRWVQERETPCLVVLTKMDDEHARPEEVMAQVRAQIKSAAAVSAMEVPDGVGSQFHGVIAVRTGRAWIGRPEAPDAARAMPVPAASKPQVDDVRAHLVDDVAGTDDGLTEKYLSEGDLSQQELDAGARAAVGRGKLLPVYEVSSTMPSGIIALLDAIVDLLPSPDERPPSMSASDGETRAPAADAPVAALVFKTHVDPHAGKVSYVRVLSGTLRQDMSVIDAASGQRERIGVLSQGTFRDGRSVADAVAGDIVAVPKLKTAKTGTTLSDERRPFVARVPPPPPALYSRTLIVDGKGVEERAAQCLHRICEEDPGLVFTHDPVSREMLVEGLGALHLDITLERLRRRASVDCHLGPPRIAYRETVRGRAHHVEGKQKKQTGGHGQFGVCYIDLEPLPHGGGFLFEDAVVGGVIPRQFVPSVEKGIRKAMTHGILAGYPVVDFKVRLVDGKYHSVDSSDAAFQVAGARALRAALQAAQPALLEPIAKLEVVVPGECLGDVMGDVHARGGRVTGTSTAGSESVVAALVPLASTQDYEPKLTSLTSGRGSFTLGFDHYDYCSSYTSERVIKESGFKPIEDGE